MNHHPDSMFEGNRKGVQVAELRCTTQTQSAEETLCLGREVGGHLRGGEIILVTGDLGAGKSVFAHGVAQRLGVDRWRGSPTFALVHEYASTPALIHVDLYRLGAEEAADLGLEEYAVPTSILLVEWADRAPEYLRSLSSAGFVEVHLGYARGDTRAVLIAMDSERESQGDAC
jgi:tRNA threonylcarbamoyladenosine biosynthesis protein TsaE